MSTASAPRLTLVVCLAATACNLNPITRRPEIVLVSRAKERELGEQEPRRVAETMGLVDDPVLTAYVSAVGQRLVEHAPGHEASTWPTPPSPTPSRCPEATSTCRAGSSRSPTRRTSSRHEIGHVAARHAVNRVTRAAPLAA